VKNLSSSDEFKNTNFVNALYSFLVENIFKGAIKIVKISFSDSSTIAASERCFSSLKVHIIK